MSSWKLSLIRFKTNSSFGISEYHPILVTNFFFSVALITYSYLAYISRVFLVGGEYEGSYW